MITAYKSYKLGLYMKPRDKLVPLLMVGRGVAPGNTMEFSHRICHSGIRQFQRYI